MSVVGVSATDRLPRCELLAARSLVIGGAGHLPGCRFLAAFPARTVAVSCGVMLGTLSHGRLQVCDVGCGCDDATATVNPWSNTVKAVGTEGIVNTDHH